MTRLLIIGLLIVSPFAAVAQKGFTSEAGAYLDQARAVMLQRDAGNPPFHLKATFTLRPGQRSAVPAEQGGTYEETWLSPTQWRRDIITAGNHFTIARGGEQVWHSAAAFPATVMLQAIAPELPHEVGEDERKKSKKPWQLDHVELNGVQLDRIGDAEHVPKHGKRVPPDDGYYFVPATRALLLLSQGWGGLQFQKITSIGGKFLPVNGTWNFALGNGGEFTVTALDVNPHPATVLFAVPAGAIVHSAVEEGDAFRMPQKVSGDIPIYPAIAKSAHIQGAVVLDAMVDADGKISEVQVASGPPLLRQSALDAARTWRYEPGLMQGAPIPVSVEIEVNYTFTSLRVF